MGYGQNLANKGLTAAVSQYSHGIREVLSGSSLGWLKSRSIEPAMCVDLANCRFTVGRLFLSPLRGLFVRRNVTHSVRCGLHSFAASRLEFGGIILSFAEEFIS
jgi:hypothetical protein